MPTDESILGFSNRWYAKGLLKNVLMNLPSGKAIQILLAPYFLATKIEAFLGRGLNDMRTSPDFEDIVTVLDGRSKIEDEILTSPQDLRDYFKLNFIEFLKDKGGLEEAIYGHLPYGSPGSARVQNILQFMEKISR